jgi:site-specific DNA-methyltransferase (adenine-specific)
MQYLVKLVTPAGGTVLDPFMGSGSTGKACVYEGFDFIGIDMTLDYVEIARARIEFAANDRSEMLDVDI